MQKVSIIGLDIAKNTFHAHGAGADGSVLLRKALPRSRVLEFLGRIAPCAVAMEACSGAHYWGRKIQEVVFIGFLRGGRRDRAGLELQSTANRAGMQRELLQPRMRI
jgi:hypothetical protein